MSTHLDMFHNQKVLFWNVKLQSVILPKFICNFIVVDISLFMYYYQYVMCFKMYYYNEAEA